MIAAFSNALWTIYNTIPMPILEAAFRPRDYQVSLDARIKDVIISGRVLSDCNINAGKIKRIALSTCKIENVLPDPEFNSILSPTPGTLYRVPQEVRENRDIVGVIDISYLYDYTGFNDLSPGFGANGNTVRSLAAAMLNSHTHRNACLTPTPTLMSNNMILITPTNSFLTDWCLVCRLGYDEEFTGLHNAAILPLSNLITTATKAYIWVNLVIRIDQAELSAGQELGQFKPIVDSYRDAVDNYREELKKFSASQLFDPAVNRYILRAML